MTTTNDLFIAYLLWTNHLKQRFSVQMIHKWELLYVQYFRMVYKSLGNGLQILESLTLE